MIDQVSLSAAREALDMEKPAGIAAAAPAAKAGLGALWRSLPGWGKALSIAGPVALGGAALAGDGGAGGGNKEQISALLRELQAARGQLAQYEETPFAPSEQRMFARHGLDPQRLRFMKTLGRFRKGMELENRMLDEALGGQLTPEAPGGALEQYA